MPDPVGKLVASPIADPGVVSLILAQPHTFVELDYEIYSTVNLHFRWFKKGCCQLQAKVHVYVHWVVYWLTT